MADCPFCKIAAGKAPSRKIYEDDSVIAFLELYPVVPGHSLVIPKKHVVWYTDLTPADAGPFSKAMYLVARQLKKAMGAEYVSVLIRGTRVAHLHAHLIPKLPGHENIFDKTLDLHHFFQARQVPVAGNAELDAVAERITKAYPA